MKILVYGWYNQNNLGDELFKDSFKQLFPSYDFIFSSYLDKDSFNDIDAVFIGGGSFLNQPINISDSSILDELKKLKIFYIGVGSETEIHSHHIQLLLSAELIAIRNDIGYERLKNINPNVIVIPDLVYNLSVGDKLPKLSKSILIIPNVLVVPKLHEPHWKHAALEYFKSEFTQFINELLKDQFTIHFLSLCNNEQLNDNYFSGELISRLTYLSADGKFILENPTDFKSVTSLISKYDAVITQRYHGSILSEIADVPSLTIHHHDKLKNVSGRTISYYGISKNLLLNELNLILKRKVHAILPIDRNIFEILKQKVEHALCRN